MSPRTLFAVTVLTGALGAVSLQPLHAQEGGTPPSAPTSIQDAPAAGDGDTAALATARTLRTRIEERWRVVFTKDGLVFVPRRTTSTVRGVELVDGELRVDGVPVSGVELRARLGSDADALLSLSYIEDETRRAAFEDASNSSSADASAAVREGRADIRRRARGRGDRINIGRDVVVREGERVGDVVAVMGSVDVDGQVDGDVVAVGGDARIGPHAVVQGEVTSVGGRIIADPAARISGERNQVTVSWPDAWRRLSEHTDGRVRRAADPQWWARAGFIGSTVRISLVALFGIIAVLLGGGVYARAREQAGDAPWQSILIGIGAQLVLAPAFIVLCGALLVSVIGIPLLALVPVLLAVVAGLWVIGFAAVVERIGQRVIRAITGEDSAPAIAFLIGVTIVVLVAWLARVAWWAGAIGFGTAIVLGLVGAVIEGLAWAAGLGALILAWLRRPSPAVTVTPPPLSPAIDSPTSL